MYYLISLKFTSKHLKRSYMFRSYDHPPGAHIVSCYSHILKQSVIYFVTLTLMMWQHVVCLYVRGTLCRVRLAVDCVEGFVLCL